MSESIYIKLRFKKEFYSFFTSETLFHIIQDGCNRRIAVTVLSEELFECDPYSCIISLADSYNYCLVNPLIGRDDDCEVNEYRPLPLKERLTNLRDFLDCIIQERYIESIEVMFTTDYDMDDLELVDVDLSQFVKTFESIIKNKNFVELNHKFILTA